ncbi:MAG: flagellar biosynthesis anti-sigma factor FlgM [Oscillospiraceae bacterium]
MKINPLSQSEAVSKIMNINRNSYSGKKISVDISDSVELSESAQKYAELVKQAKENMASSETDEAVKVADIVSRMNSNTYSVSDDDLVDNILGGIPKNI